MTALSRRRMLGASALAGACFGAETVRAGGANRRVPRPGGVPGVVCVYLKGGADGLSLLVPYSNDHYRRARPTTAIAAPGAVRGAAVALTDGLGLHPALAPLRSWYESEELALVVGVGPAGAPRSHFEAERHLVRGCAEHFEQRRVARGSLESIAARIAEGDDSFDAGWVTLHGWDTHAAQGDGTGGRFAHLVGELAESLVAFRHRVAHRFEDTIVVVLSEFGRTLSESRMAGTDDGRGGVALVFGGPVAGGRVYGTWDELDAQSVEPLAESRTAPHAPSARWDAADLLAALLGDHGARRAASLTRLVRGAAR